MIFFSSHRKKLEPKRRFGGRAFRDKIKSAANYKRIFNPSGGFSLKFFPSSAKPARVSLVVGVIILLVGVYFMTISSFFSVTNITIKGNRQISTQQILDTLASAGNSRLFLIKKNNFFLMTQGRVNDLLTFSTPTIKQIVSYQRTWPDKVTIEVTEHTPGFVIESSGKYFLVDDEGAIVSQIDPSTPQKLMIAHDQLIEDFARGEILPSQKLALFILSMNKLWNTKMSVPIVVVRFPGKGSSEVEFVTAVGYSVLFDTKRSVSVQLSDLAVILSKQIKPIDQPNLAYIDLRLSKWAYYCFKASPCHQQEQPSHAGTSTEKH